MRHIVENFIYRQKLLSNCIAKQVSIVWLMTLYRSVGPTFWSGIGRPEWFESHSVLGWNA